MKLTSAVSAIVLLLPVLAQAAVVPRNPTALIPRQRGGDRKDKADKAKADAEKAKADKAKADADKAKADADKAKADKAKADADKAKADKAKADANKAKADKAGADKAKADADKAAADKAKAEADKAKGGKGTGKNNNNKGGNQNGGNNGAPPPPPPAGGNQNGGNKGAPAGGNNNNGDPQKSLTLDPAVIQPGLAQSGQNGTPEPGQVASLTSTNNFINFCLTTGLALTNGQQIKEGSCNPTPMGVIVSQAKMPSAKFVSPKNGDTIKANVAFDIKLAVKNMQTGNFVNPNANYFAAPAQVNKQGIIIAHSHVVIQKLPSVDTTQVPDPGVFQFFKGLNSPDQGGILTTTVTSPTTKGVPPGAYRLCSINTAANHQPILVAVAQHGSLDDCIYFTAE